MYAIIFKIRIDSTISDDDDTHINDYENTLARSDDT